MSEFRYSVDIRSSPSRVWSVLLDVERWPEWNASVKKVKRMDIGPLTLGSRTRIWQPRLMPAVWQVTSFDEQRRVFAWSTHAPRAHIVGCHQVENVKAQSRVTLTLRYTGALGELLGRVFRDLTWEYVKREGDGLREHCEMPALRLPAEPRIQGSQSS
jgi:hypothetical protein